MIDALNRKFFKTAKNMDIETDRKVRLLEYMLKLGVDINDLEKYSNQSLLMIALDNEEYEVARLFLDKGGNVNLEDVEERTALFFVKDEKIAQELIDRGADVNHKAFGDRTPLMMCKGEKVSEVLVKNGALINAKTKYKKWDLTEYSYTFIEGGCNALMYAISNNDVKKIEFLLNNGAEVDVKNDVGENCLIYGLRCGCKLKPEVVDWLVVRGIDVNDTCFNGCSALFYVVNNKEVARKLIEKKANMYAMNKNGETAFMNAIRLADKEVVKAFVENKAYVNHKEKENGDTALICAIKRNHMDVAEYLIEKGADVNMTGDNTTALIEACLKNHNGMVKLLIDKGAKVNAVTKEGDTAICMAVYHCSNEKVVEVLLEHGANYKKKNKDGVSAWTLADMDNYEKGTDKMADLIMAEEIRRKNTISGAVKNVFDMFLGQ